MTEKAIAELRAIGQRGDVHFDSYVRAHEERFEARSGPLCLVVVRSVEAFLDCGRLQGGFARINNGRLAGTMAAATTPAFTIRFTAG